MQLKTIFFLLMLTNTTQHTCFLHYGVKQLEDRYFSHSASNGLLYQDETSGLPSGNITQLCHWAVRTTRDREKNISRNKHTHRCQQLLNV